MTNNEIEKIIREWFFDVGDGSTFVENDLKIKKDKRTEVRFNMYDPSLSLSNLLSLQKSFPVTKVDDIHLEPFLDKKGQMFIGVYFWI
jgi:hypothetical protein